MKNNDSLLGIAPAVFLGKILKDIAEGNECFTLMYSDCAQRIGIDELIAEHPEKCIQCGIAEQNQIAASAALALEGQLVFAVAYAPFITARVLDQIRVFLGYMESPVILVGLAAGFGGGDLGATHTALEDVASIRTIPGIDIISPSGNTELMAAVTDLASNPRPAYIRVPAANVDLGVDNNDSFYKPGKAAIIRQGTDVAFVSTGSLTLQAVLASKLLQEKGISCSVIHMATLVPFDEDCMHTQINARYIVTLEEHAKTGGLGGIVAEYLSGYTTHPKLIRLGSKSAYAKADTPDKLIHGAGLSSSEIVKRVATLFGNE